MAYKMSPQDIVDLMSMKAGNMSDLLTDGNFQLNKTTLGVLMGLANELDSLAVELSIHPDLHFPAHADETPAEETEE